MDGRGSIRHLISQGSGTGFVKTNEKLIHEQYNNEALKTAFMNDFCISQAQCFNSFWSRLYDLKQVLIFIPVLRGENDCCCPKFIKMLFNFFKKFDT